MVADRFIHVAKIKEGSQVLCHTRRSWWLETPKSGSCSSSYLLAAAGLASFVESSIDKPVPTKFGNPTLGPRLPVSIICENDFSKKRIHSHHPCHFESNRGLFPGVAGPRLQMWFSNREAPGSVHLLLFLKIVPRGAVPAVALRLSPTKCANFSSWWK